MLFRELRRMQDLEGSQVGWNYTLIMFYSKNVGTSKRRRRPCYFQVFFVFMLAVLISWKVTGIFLSSKPNRVQNVLEDSLMSSCKPIRVGGNPENAWYGAWWLCEETLHRSGLTLISFGSGCDSTFEWDFMWQSSSPECHVFDPTITPDRFWMCSNNSKKIISKSKSIQIDTSYSPNFWH